MEWRVRRQCLVNLRVGENRLRTYLISSRVRMAYGTPGFVTERANKCTSAEAYESARVMLRVEVDPQDLVDVNVMVLSHCAAMRQIAGSHVRLQETGIGLISCQL